MSLSLERTASFGVSDHGSPRLSEVALSLGGCVVGSSLSAAEHRQRDDCEALIGEGWDTFLVVGQALLTTRQGRLYREQFSTFEDYCRQKWGFSKSHANRLIEAAIVASVLTPIGVKPRSESQLRPLTGLEPQEIPEAWKRAQRLVGSGEVTAKAVRLAAKELKREGTDPMRALSKHPVGENRPEDTALLLLNKAELAANRKDVRSVLKILAMLRKCLEISATAPKEPKQLACPDSC